MKQVIVALALGIAAAAPHAQAAPLQWSLSDVGFLDGGTASGSFDFDANTTTYSDIDITTTTGTDFAGAAYTALAPGPTYVPSDEVVFFVTTTQADLSGTPLLGFLLPEPLTDLGGAIPLASSVEEYTCLDATCQTADPLRTVEAGFVTTLSLGEAPPGQAVPEPATFAILGAGVIGLGVARRRRASLPA